MDDKDSALLKEIWCVVKAFFIPCILAFLGMVILTVFCLSLFAASVS